MGNLPEPAQYLLRVDDLCPTVDADGWERLRLMIKEFRLRPILAIVPENRDADLEIAAPAADFWEQVRMLQAEGAAIALHGLHHTCHARGKSLLNLHRTSEFAGVAESVQKEWIGQGVKLLRGHGLYPKLWVAPRHGFDRSTIAALRAEGLQYLSDGLARAPFRRRGVTWIPMQLWEPVVKEKGVWTICIHPNTMDDSRYRYLRKFVAEFANQFTSFDEIADTFHGGELPGVERLIELLATVSLRLRRRVRPQLPRIRSADF